MSRYTKIRNEQSNLSEITENVINPKCTKIQFLPFISNANFFIPHKYTVDLIWKRKWRLLTTCRISYSNLVTLASGSIKFSDIHTYPISLTEMQ